MKGRPIRYSAEELAWLEAHHTLPLPAYHAGFCARFARSDVLPVHLAALRKRKGWKTGRSGRFERGHVPANKGKPCPPGRGGNHPNASRHWFVSGQAPHNASELGHERINKDGYVEICIAAPNPYTGAAQRYVLKHRWLWEQANGPVPAGHALKCRDGNRLNTDPANWEAVPRAILPRLAGAKGYRHTLPHDQAAPELRPLIVALARLRHAARGKGRAS
jgi:hypothetical protein